MSISKEQADELKRLARESSPKGTYLAYGQLLDYIDSLTGKDEPVAWLSTAGSLWKTRAFQDDTPLYASPQPAPPSIRAALVESRRIIAEDREAFLQCACGPYDILSQQDDATVEEYDAALRMIDEAMGDDDDR
jgi:hypothetical protein